MNEEGISRAVAAWRERIGAEQVVTEPAQIKAYGANVSGEHRDIVAILRPASTAEVQAVVETANQYGVPLHPVSTGNNWGLGSRLPVRDGAAIVDLRRMNRILEVNVPLHYAVVEAGVTQGQLHDHLCRNNLPLLLNVTGSALDTSLIGNALERGVGYFASRADSLSGLEVVLGNGRVIRTGTGHFPGSVTSHTNPHGVGPSLDGLFAQSNFGVVTQAGVDLIPKRDAHVAMVGRVRRDEDLGPLVERFAELARRGIIQTAVHIANADRTRISVEPLLFNVLVQRRGYAGDAAREIAADWLRKAGFGAWSVVGGLMGTRGQLREAKREVRRALRGLGRVVFISDFIVSGARRLARWTSFVPWVRRQEALLDAVEPLYNLSKGIPTDEALKGVSWPVTGEAPPAGANPDEGV
ncbi:MAG: FAD-binding oxidoreductase, partial [Kiritimatiellae bacterium]|nr:FAD-binding oxidoreductase [Kiritimatiellia bacterium]